jgi:hypothetical protein
MNPEELTRYLDRLVEEAEDSAPSVSFSHVLVEVGLEELLPELRSVVTEANFELYCRFTDASSVATDQLFYVGTAAESEALLWLFSIDTRLMEQLSRRLQCRVHWISVDEDLRARGYLCYDDGALLSEVLDPPELWTARLLRGSDLRGDGERIFSSHGEFLEAISEFYEPRDQVWTFGRWDDKEWRAETLAEVASSISESVLLRISPAEYSCEFIGGWSDFDRARVTRRTGCRQVLSSDTKI